LKEFFLNAVGNGGEKGKTKNMTKLNLSEPDFRWATLKIME
jgi:hypothetical protein